MHTSLSYKYCWGSKDDKYFKFWTCWFGGEYPRNVIHRHISLLFLHSPPHLHGCCPTAGNQYISSSFCQRFIIPSASGVWGPSAGLGFWSLCCPLRCRTRNVPLAYRKSDITYLFSGYCFISCPGQHDQRRAHPALTMTMNWRKGLAITYILLIKKVLKIPNTFNWHYTVTANEIWAMGLWEWVILRHEAYCAIWYICGLEILWKQWAKLCSCLYWYT